MATQNSTGVDVVISGLGPTGLTLAHLLGRRGISVLVLEREPRFYGNARAVYTDDECMRIFQAAGMADELARDMLQDAIFQWVLPDGRVLNQLIQKERPYGWPANNLFYQPFLETSLAEGLARYPTVSVCRGRELTRFAQDGDGVTVFHVPSEGAQYSRPATVPGVVSGPPQGEESIRGKYLVACDGGRSAVRAQLGINMTGKSFPNPWIVVDIREKAGEDCLRHLPYFDFICDPELPTVSCPQPDRRHRFEFMLHDDDQTAEFEDTEMAVQLLSRHVDAADVVIDRQLAYTFNALVADRWRLGRIVFGNRRHIRGRLSEGQALIILPTCRTKAHGHQKNAQHDKNAQHQNRTPCRRYSRSPKAKLVAIALTRAAKSSPSATRPMLSKNWSCVVRILAPLIGAKTAFGSASPGTGPTTELVPLSKRSRNAIWVPLYSFAPPSNLPCNCSI